MGSDAIISLVVLVVVAAAVIFFGIKKQPGIGIISAILIIGVSLFLRGKSITSIGLQPPENWGATAFWSLGLGIVIALMSTAIIEPLTDKVTDQPHDLTVFDNMRGNLKLLIVWLLTSWVLASFLEEIIFRGYMMSELGSFTGKYGLGASINLLLSSTVFGLAHWYQGKSGALSTAIVGMLICNIFIWNDYNLWLPILTHGVINTVGLVLIYTELDGKIRKSIWKVPQLSKSK
ncbi:MAG: CPBP family intramembrane glutamic endopeptidase [Chloroflexota bacterium]